MIDLFETCQKSLREAGISTQLSDISGRSVLAFESSTCLGFILSYDDSKTLVQRWHLDSKVVIDSQQLGLRRAKEKAWNTYTIFLTAAEDDEGSVTALGSIEEDLVGTRKIARAGVNSEEKLRSALLPLLPIQSGPRLEAINMVEEIQLRTTELPRNVLDAFFSNAHESVIAQVLEEVR
jgi:hypothetical protein